MRTCDHCDFSTFMSTMMCKHEEQYHSKKSKPVILLCEQCRFIATKQVSLEIHQIVHSTKPPYRCAECNVTIKHLIL